MAISESNTASIDSEDPSDWVRLAVGTNRLLIEGDSAAGTRVDIQYSPDGVKVFRTEFNNLVPDTTILFDGVVGFVRLYPHFYDAGETFLTVLNSIDNRP